MFVYIKSDDELWTVGHYKPDGKWVPESDHGVEEDAAKRTAWLNGGCDFANLVSRIESLESAVKSLDERDEHARDKARRVESAFGR